MSIAGKSAVVTGAGSGIGKAIALTLSRSGARVSACARSAAALEELKNAIDAARGAVHTGHCDVSDPASVAAFFQGAREAFGPTDILVVNAGIGIFKPVEELPLEDFDAVLATNLRGAFLCVKQVLPDMLARESGDIIFISSLAGKNGMATGGAYCASKFAVRGLAQSLMHEVRDRGVRVATIFPGSVDTAFIDEMPSSSKRSKILQSDDVADAVLAALTAPRRALLSEIDIRPSNPR